MQYNYKDTLSLPKTHWIETEHYGLIGKPLRKSTSSLMQNTNFAAMGMNAAYYPIEVEESELPIVMPAFLHMGYRGLNVTMPLKKAVIPYLDGLDEIGGLCGAVNTIAVRDGKMIGTNTDSTGFIHSLKEQGDYDPASRSCILFGAGGAGRGVAFGLVKAGIGSLTLVDIPKSKELLDTLVGELNSYKTGVAKGLLHGTGEAAPALREAELVVNATSVGMAPGVDGVICDTELLTESQMVCDVVYVPHRTRLLELAARKGCRTLEGVWMQLWQGVDAFRFWTGMEPNVEVMKEVILKLVQG